MGILTKIQWCDHTWNPWRGCAKPPATEDGTGIAPECFFCYAEAGSKRNPKTLGVWGKEGLRAIGVESYWRLPLRWASQAREDGVRRRVFFSSLADVFEDRDDLVAHRERAFRTIDLCPELDFLVLTKRPELVPRLWPGDPRRNVWLGTSCGANSSRWRIDALRRSAHLAELLFISAEPLVEEVDLAGRLEGVSWLIVGGESGHKARTFGVAWADRLLEQARRADVAFFMKQFGSRPWPWTWWDESTSPHAERSIRDPKGGEPLEWPERLRVREFPRALMVGGVR